MNELSRREFMKAGGALVVGFSWALDGVAQRPATESAPVARTLDTNEVDGFLAVNADGTVTIFCGKVDLGQGLRIAIPQMAAEELGVDIARVTMIEGDTALTPDQGPTAGSSGIMRGGVQIRQAAATARQALIARAAERIGKPAAELDVQNGAIRPKSGGAAISYADLVNGKPFALKVDAKAPLRDPATYTIVGKPMPRPDVPRKVTGRHVYVHDFRVDGMLHGRVLRPASVGAKLLAVDEETIKSIPGARVVRVNDFLGVVADTEWDAVVAARQLRTRWSETATLIGDGAVRESMRAGPFESDEVLVNKGDTGACARSGGKAALGGVLLADANAWLDRTVVRDRRRARRQGDDLERIAGDASFPGHDRTHAGTAESCRPHRLSRRRGLLWDERSRRCSSRRRAAVEGGGSPCARPVDARRRAWLGSERPAAAARLRGRPRRRRHDFRVAHADVAAEGDREPAEYATPRPAGCGNRADARNHHRSHQPEWQPAVRGGESGSARALAEGRAAAALQSARARQDRQLLRGRELHRRARRRCAPRPGCVPARGDFRPARRRSHQAHRGAHRLAATPVAGTGRPRPRLRLHSLQEQRDVRGDGHGSGSRSCIGRNPCAPRRMCARLRTRHQSRCTQAADRGLDPADAFPRAARGGDVRSRARHERRLEKLSDPHVSARCRRS